MTDDHEQYDDDEQGMEAASFEPPDHLSESSQDLWRCFVPRRAKSVGRLVVIAQAIEALERAESASEQIERDGMTSTTATTGTIHAHPLLKVEREARAQFLRTWSDLGFDFEKGVDDHARW